jgi:hypothetical protein
MREAQRLPVHIRELLSKLLRLLAAGIQLRMRQLKILESLIGRDEELENHSFVGRGAVGTAVIATRSPDGAAEILPWYLSVISSDV